jgi:hypothetical protein
LKVLDVVYGASFWIVEEASLAIGEAEKSAYSLVEDIYALVV